MPVQMQLSRIFISEISEQQVIYLKEVEGDRQFPILIGIFEATSIDRRVKSYRAPRPLTHDLLVNVVEAMGAELDSVVISELRDHTYFAKLRVRQNGEILEIDSRPMFLATATKGFVPRAPPLRPLPRRSKKARSAPTRAMASSTADSNNRASSPSRSRRRTNASIRLGPGSKGRTVSVSSAPARATGARRSGEDR